MLTNSHTNGAREVDGVCGGGARGVGGSRTLVFVHVITSHGGKCLPPRNGPWHGVNKRTQQKTLRTLHGWRRVYNVYSFTSGLTTGVNGIRCNDPTSSRSIWELGMSGVKGVTVCPCRPGVR